MVIFNMVYNFFVKNTVHNIIVKNYIIVSGE